MVQATPKFRSKEFKDAAKALKNVFDAQSLGVVLLDALDRQSAEKIHSRVVGARRGQRLASLKKTEIVGPMAAGAFASDEVLYQLLKELDRACRKERHIVASIPEAQAGDRIGSYRALALKRERAKFVWALARDDRASVRDLANRVIKEFFEEAAEFQVVSNTLEGKAEEGALKKIDLAHRLKEQAERFHAAREKVSVLESKVAKFEAERATLLVEIGQKERALRRESETREELERHMAEQKSALKALEAERAHDETERTQEMHARETVEELSARVRRLTKLADASTQLSSQKNEIQAARRQVQDLMRSLRQKEADQEKEHAAFKRQESKLRDELTASREDLKQARRRITELEKQVAQGPAHPEGESAKKGVAVLLDQANLAGSATALYGRKVNFTAVLDQLRAGRSLVKAAAFVVDNGGSSFGAFCDTLRRSGWGASGQTAQGVPKRSGQGRLGYGHRDGGHWPLPPSRDGGDRVRRRGLCSFGQAVAAFRTKGRSGRIS